MYDRSKVAKIYEKAFIKQISHAEKLTEEFCIFLPMMFLMALVSLNSFFNS